MTKKTDEYRFYINKINIFEELVYLSIFRRFSLFKTYLDRRYQALKCGVMSFLANQGTSVP